MLSNKLYNVLKWLTLLGIPAFATFYCAMAVIWVWDYADEIAKTAAAVCTLLGTLIGISTHNYNKVSK